MATNFPTSLDALTNPTGSSDLTSPDHAGQHADANDAIEALQAKVGVNGSAVTTSLDYKVANMLPSGMIAPYAGTTAPSGWQLCDGTGLNPVAQPALFAVIGYTYGGSGGTFNVPDMRTRVPVGKNGSGTFATLGSKAGTETHTLTTSEMPSHTHTQNAHNHGITDNGHTHNLPYVFGAAGGTIGMLVSGVNSLGQAINSNTTGITINNQTATNQNTGGGGAHNNLQPYIVLNYIIKL